MAKKIPTALVRSDVDRTKVLPEVNPGCEWVFAGEGVPTRKWNGTCVMLDEHGYWWARREVKPGKGEPENYILVDYDEVTGKSQGWEPMEQSSWNKFLIIALRLRDERGIGATPGTYELMGPKIQGNEDGFDNYVLEKHSEAPVIEALNFAFPVPTVMLVLDRVSATQGIEGVVWHHPDGRMAKLKARDLRYV